MTAAPQRPPWRHRHLLDVDVLSVDELHLVLDRAALMAAVVERGTPLDALRGRRVVTLFHEPSTRTRVSFEIAARNLSADVTSVNVATSSVTKGESVVDTVRTLEALGAAVLVVRHGRSGVPWLVARHFRGNVVNAGDGWHAHPTQALLDLFTLLGRLGTDTLDGVKVAIVGDLLHSRVARSNLWTLTAFGAELWLCGPPTLVRGFAAWAAVLPPERRVRVTTELDEALDGAHAVMALRLQQERQQSGLLPSLREYASRYGITERRLEISDRDVVVLHPGPMNEGVEIAPDVAAGPRSLVTAQVAAGVPVRMAVLALLTEAGGDA